MESDGQRRVIESDGQRGAHRRAARPAAAGPPSSGGHKRGPTIRGEAPDGERQHQRLDHQRGDAHTRPRRQRAGEADQGAPALRATPNSKVATITPVAATTASAERRPRMSSAGTNPRPAQRHRTASRRPASAPQRDGSRSRRRRDRPQRRGARTSQTATRRSGTTTTPTRSFMRA